MPLRPTDLRTEHLVNPLGLDEPAPRFSWKLADTRTGAAQTSYQLEVSADGAVVWDSQRVDSDTSVLVAYAGPTLAPHTRYHWRVRVWDHTGTVSVWSDSAFFETGFLAPLAPWPAAEWIAHPSLPKTPADRPAAQLRKTLKLSTAPREARLYVTARGIFEPHINGKRIGRDHLTPGWTDYRHRLEYLTYDVTAQLVAGDNTLSALLADGWYCGWFGFKRMRDHYGNTPALYAVLRIVETDGSVRWIGTDSTWRASTGPILNADLYDGESLDARLAFGQNEKPARALSFPWIPLAAKAFGRVRTTEELKTAALTQPAKGSHVFDLGQNMVGNIRLRLRAPRGTRITIRYAEMLQADGTLYTANYRSAKSTDTYICSGKGVETYEPRFTFHGFRYVELTGLKTKPKIDAVTGLVWHTEMESTGTFACSDPLINQLQSNIRWGQRGNFLELPTDCPQRDERLGWTGDAQVFIPTAAFNYDVASFFRKWTRDLADGQHATGAYPDTAPDLYFNIWPSSIGGNAAWAEAGMICPWVVYQKYGDTRILAENYPAMTRYVAYLEKSSDRLIRPDTCFGDWLSPEATKPDWAATPCDLIGTAYFARATDLLSQIAAVLGHTADARRYASLHRRILTAFNRHYVTADTRLAGDTQTAYLLALGFDLLPEKKRAAALTHLERTLKRRNDHLCTGFVGTPLLCPVLTRFGRIDLAYKLLFNDAYPSWLFPIKNGATTMWERWNSWTPDKGFGEVGMNSFNHYAYGAIGEWLYATVAGISELAPGFKKILLRPQPNEKLTRAAASLDTPYGVVSSAWKRTRSAFTWTVVVPPNTTALAIPPVASLDQVRVPHGVPTTTHEGLPALALAAGHYMFTFPSSDEKGCVPGLNVPTT
jgi:alpha-L-rhamnosidase